jgi:hypothetical protein
MVAAQLSIVARCSLLAVVRVVLWSIMLLAYQGRARALPSSLQAPLSPIQSHSTLPY